MLRNGLEPWHIIVLLAVVLLVFGGKKLPELARGSGRALRIFKAETKGVFTDDEEAPTTGTSTGTSTGTPQLDAGAAAHPTETAAPVAPAQAPPPVGPEAVRHDAGTD